MSRSINTINCFASPDRFGKHSPFAGRPTVAAVRFYNSNGRLGPKLYHYWVPAAWALQTGDHIGVMVARTPRRVCVAEPDVADFSAQVSVIKAAAKLLARAEPKSDDRIDALTFGTAIHQQAENDLKWGSELFNEVTSYLHRPRDPLLDYKINLNTDRSAHNPQLSAYAAQLYGTPKILDVGDRVSGTFTFTLTPADLPTDQEPTMNIKIETRTFFNGEDIKGMSDDYLFQQIANAEAEIRRLEAIETKPAKLAARIDALRVGIADLAAAIDARA